MYVIEQAGERLCVLQSEPGRGCVCASAQTFTQVLISEEVVNRFYIQRINTCTVGEGHNAFLTHLMLPHKVIFEALILIGGLKNLVT